MAAFPRPTALAVGFTLLLASACTGAGSSPDADPSSTSPGPSFAPEPRTPGDASYRVSLSSDVAGRVWTGSERIAFTNTGAEPLPLVWLRLWSNGQAGCDPLAIGISGVGGGTLGPPILRCTAYPVRFDEPLGPGVRTSLTMSLRIVVPSANQRFGSHDGITLLGTALPTLAVHDQPGWALDPFVGFGESFYSLAGRYQVQLRVPSVLDTPTTGQLVDARTEGGIDTRTYRAQDVRDFAWAAGRFDVRQATVEGVDVRVWYLPSVTSGRDATAQLDEAVGSMKVYDADFGAYPYAEFDVVSTAFAGYGGMEYPQIVFANPGKGTVAHELAHQWWYGIVGNDEYRDPWLDESFATWSQFLPGAPTYCDPRGFTFASPDDRIDADMGYWAAQRGRRYGYTVYGGGSCLLQALSDRFGRERFVRFLATWAQDHWLGIATTAEFEAAVDRVAADEFPGFDTQAFWARWRMG